MRCSGASRTCSTTATSRRWSPASHRIAWSALPSSRSSAVARPSARSWPRAFAGDTIANVWEGTWEDAKTGKRMAGRGLEVWRMRDGMIAVWEAAFNVWERDGERTSPIM